MNKNVKKIFGERLTELIYTKYAKKTDFYRDFEQKLDSKNITGKEGKSFNVIETGKKWTNGETVPDNLEILISLANFFNVSIDYLLGNAEKPTDYSEQYIHEYTGLAHSSIRILNKSKNNCFHVHPYLDFLLEPDDNIEEKIELIFQICNYILNSENITSYYEDGVSKIKNENIGLCDEYGKAVASVKTKDMGSAMLLSINTYLNMIRSKTNASKEKMHPSIYDILEEIMDDLQTIEDIRNDENAICEAHRLAIHERRYKEHVKRLQYLYGCDTINDIDFEKFRSEYPKYSDNEIELLKKNLDL